MTIIKTIDKTTNDGTPDLIKDIHQYLAADIQIMNEVILKHLLKTLYFSLSQK